jgi:hypothetical protein
MTITPIRAPRATVPVRPLAHRSPTEAELFPFLDQVEVCIYCGRFQTDEQAEQRGAEHIQRDLVAVHRASEALIRDFGVPHPGYQHDVYDLLCELDNAVYAAAAAPLVFEPAVTR